MKTMAVLLGVTLVLTGAAAAETNALAAAETAVATNAPAALRPTHITAANTYYDRKEGVAIFSGHVHVDDARFQMHANKAYVFMSKTNDVERVVAIGSVAVTNDTKRAYGSRVTYYRDRGLIVLHSAEGTPAEVRDERKDGDQVVRGRKIRFWTDSEQVEVVEAVITAPAKLGKDGTLPALK